MSFNFFELLLTKLCVFLQSQKLIFLNFWRFASLFTFYCFGHITYNYLWETYIWLVVYFKKIEVLKSQDFFQTFLALQFSLSLLEHNLNDDTGS